MSQSSDDIQIGRVEAMMPCLDSEESRATETGLGHWLCAACHQRVAHDRDRLSVMGASEHEFVNPAGIKFNILLFGEAAGCLDVGMPTLKHTWFPGCAWSYCLCERCRHHLGWFYTGARVFVGLIRGRIVRAVLVHN